MADKCKSATHCYLTKNSRQCVKPNPWVVFLRTHKGKYANKEDMLADYKADFQVKMQKRLSSVEDKTWSNKRKREEYQKILCRYFHEHMKKAGKNSPKNKEDMSVAIGKVLKKNRSTRASLSAIKKMNPSVSAAQVKKKKKALEQKKIKAKEALVKKQKKAKEALERKEKKAEDALAKKEKRRKEVLAKRAKKAKEASGNKEKKGRGSPVNKTRKLQVPKKKPPLALQRLEEDLRPSKKQVRFGAAGRGGRPRAPRALYEPSTGEKRRSPSKANPNRKKKTSVRSTIDNRVAVARQRARGREQATDKENQCNVIEFMKNVADPAKNQKGKYANTKGLLVAHGMGSGKTLTSLWVAKEYIAKNRVDFVNIIAPNVAVGEFIDSFERAGITPRMAGRIRVLTHDEFALNRKEREFKKSLVIVDEAHMFAGIKYDALVKCDVPYIMLLSGTPAPNTPCEIVPLINLLYKDKRLWWRTAKWDKKTTTLSDQKSFLKDKVSMYNIGSDHNYMRQRGMIQGGANQFPGYKVSTRKVKLSAQQNKAYLRLLKKIKKESHKEKMLHPFNARERVIVHTHPTGDPSSPGEVTPKVAKVAKDVVRQIRKTHSKVEKGTGRRKQGKSDAQRLLRGRILLYAYNVDVTINLEAEIRRLCDEKKITPRIALYNGDISTGDRADAKEAFNKGEIDLLIISKAGSVGLDLQCTSKVFMFDMCWNIPQMNQIIGRAIRFKSHHEPCEHDHVDVYIYRSVFATKQATKVFDHQVLVDAVKKWKRVAGMLENVMKPSSIKNSTVCAK